MATKQDDPQTYEIIGALMEVHSVLGPGFSETVYQAALETELRLRGIPFEAQAPVSILYKGVTLPCTYRLDFRCFNEVIVELKALDKLSGTEEAQVINYLKATGLRRGLLVNFGGPSLEYKRFAN